MSDNPKHDFRYRDEAGVELEAFQVTPAGRWAAQDWPTWLQTQGSANELNKVYTDPANPNSLFINLEAGRFGIEENAYILYEGGNLKVESKEQFEGRFTKVVPIPPRKLDAPSLERFERTHRIDENNKLVKLSPEEIAALPPEDDMEMTQPLPIAPKLSVVEPVIGSQASMLAEYNFLLNEVREAFQLCDRDYDKALHLRLRTTLVKRTDWCDCPPGTCDSTLDEWGCRQNSPLVK